MTAKRKLIVKIAVWGTILILASIVVVRICSSRETNKKPVTEITASDDRFLNDDLVSEKAEDGTTIIRNIQTGEITAKGIEFDWSWPSPNDSLGVFCYKNKRGYYNSYTGKIAIEAKYRRAWIFSDGIAAVQKDGNIGFINRKGEVVIPFQFPYYGNNLSSYVFKNGYCIVANKKGKCGIINTKGEWVIEPEYEYIETFNDYVIATRAGVRCLIDYNGKILNDFILDKIRPLTYKKREVHTDNNGKIVYDDCGNVTYVEIEVNTNFYAYCIGERWGLMDSKCKRITAPLYSRIIALNESIFRGILLDRYSEILINNKGEIIQ